MEKPGKVWEIVNDICQPGKSFVKSQEAFEKSKKKNCLSLKLTHWSGGRVSTLRMAGGGIDP